MKKQAWLAVLCLGIPASILFAGDAPKVTTKKPLWIPYIQGNGEVRWSYIMFGPDSRFEVNCPAIMEQLIEDSIAGKMLYDSTALQEGHVDNADVTAFTTYINRYPDCRSYHLLFALNRDYPDVYKQIRVGVRAAVLCSVLTEASILNDWGDLGAEPEFCLDCEPAKALLDIGSPALPYLSPLLDDLRPATLEGCEEATESEECQYRRADWACQFMSMILGIPYEFSRSPAERDKGIALLKAKLEADARMFPDGRCHDFGTITPGSCPRYAFRIVNTSDVPLRILRWDCLPTVTELRAERLRFPGSFHWPRGSVNKDVLQPGEEGKLEVTANTRRLLWSRTASCFVTIEQRGTIEKFRFTITADSIDGE